jgi:ketosteroid isomerase-like protein
MPSGTGPGTAAPGQSYRAARTRSTCGAAPSQRPGVPTSGRRFRVRGATVLELRDGRVTRNADYWDPATLLNQLGLLP